MEIGYEGLILIIILLFFIGFSNNEERKKEEKERERKTLELIQKAVKHKHKGHDQDPKDP